MKPATLLVTLLFAAGLSSCQERKILPAINSEKGTILLRHNQTYDIEDPDIELWMTSVLNDSRCPTDASCVSSGNAQVQFSIEVNEHITTFVLNTGLAPASMLIDGYTVRLIGLTPSPTSTKSLSQDSYTAEVSLTKN